MEELGLENTPGSKVARRVKKRGTEILKMADDAKVEDGDEGRIRKTTEHQRQTFGKRCKSTLQSRRTSGKILQKSLRKCTEKGGMKVRKHPGSEPGKMMTTFRDPITEDLKSNSPMENYCGFDS